jgi:AraC-like DNA-binding protein
MPTLRPLPTRTPRTLHAGYARTLIGVVLAQRPEWIASLSPRELSFLDDTAPLARCTLAEWHALLDAGERLLGGQDLVPALSEQFKPWHAGTLGFALMTSGDVQALGGLLRRFQHLLNDVFKVELGVTGSRFFLSLAPTSAERSPRLARCLLSMWAQRLRWLTGQPHLRLDVSFEGPAPSEPRAYQALFGGTVRFGQDNHTMWGDVACLNMPLVSRHSGNHAVLQGQLHKQLEHLSGGDDRLVERLQALVQARLALGQPSLEDTANALRMPPRTLQRRLEEAGVHFRLLVEAVRKSQAQHCLRETRMPLAELATSLGFADHASFTRAFKRWTGHSPDAFRRAHAQLEALSA